MPESSTIRPPAPATEPAPPMHPMHPSTMPPPDSAPETIATVLAELRYSRKHRDRQLSGVAETLRDLSDQMLRMIEAINVNGSRILTLEETVHGFITGIRRAAAPDREDGSDVALMKVKILVACAVIDDITPRSRHGLSPKTEKKKRDG